MDLETIKKIVAEKGYAFLTTEQKAVYNAPVVSTKAVETSELGFGSSSAGVDLLKQKEATATKITTPPVVPSTVVDTTKETKEPLPDNTVTLVGPSGEKITFQDWTNNKENIQGWIDKGYQFMEGSNAPVEFATGGGETPQTSSEQIQLDKDKADYDSAVSQLKNFSGNLANDPALINMLTGISGQWEVRIKEQEQINKSRNAAMTTAGFRLGSRYAGGSIGPMAGIISAEERAGMDRIASLLAQKDQALLEAKSAYETKKWTQYSKLVDIAEKAYSDSLKAVSDLNKITIEEDNKRKEKLREEKMILDTEKIITDLINVEGITDRATLIGKLGGKVKTEIIDNYLDRLQEATGATSTDYNTWKVETAKGNTDKGFLDWVKEFKETTKAPKIVTLTQEDEFGNKIQVPYIFDPESGQLVSLGASGGSASGGTISGGSEILQNAFRKVLGSTTAAERKSFGSAVNNLLKSGDNRRALESIIDKAVETGGTEMYQQYLTHTSVVNSLNKLETKLDEYVKAGGSTNLLRGSIEDITQKLGATSDKTLLRIGSEISQVLFDYRRSLSGVAFPPEETKQYKKILPSISKTIEVNKELIDSFRENNIAKIENTLRARLSPSNYDPLRDDILESLFSMKTKTEETREYNGHTYKKANGGWELVK